MEESPALVIVEVPGCGRGAIASRAIKKGEVVIREEPYAWCVSDAYASVCCQWCGAMRVGQSVMTIAETDRYRYCSEGCIIKDYGVHQHEVAALARIEGEDVEPRKLVVRVAANRKLESALDLRLKLDGVQNGKENRFQHLLLLESSSQLQGLTHSTLYAKLSIICKMSGLALSPEEAAHLMTAIRKNAHQIISSDGLAIGLGIFPLTSMLNHSCTPNFAHSFLIESGQSPKLVMRAIRNVEKGEQLMYNYCPLYSSTETRRELLEHCYSFTCVCDRCLRNDDHCLGDRVLGPHQSLQAIEDYTLELTCSVSPSAAALQKLLDMVHKEMNSGGVSAANRSIFQACVCLLNSATRHLGVTGGTTTTAEGEGLVVEIIILSVVAAGCLGRYCLPSPESHLLEMSAIYDNIELLLATLIEPGGKSDVQNSSCKQPARRVLCDAVTYLLSPSIACEARTDVIELVAHAVQEHLEVEVSLPFRHQQGVLLAIRVALTQQIELMNS